MSVSKRRGDTSGSLIFPGEPLAPAQHLGRRSAPQGTHAVGISVDHPLSFPSDAPAHYPSNRPSQPAMKPTGFAGKASGVEVPRLQRSEPRHQYEPPTYQIRRTPADSGTKDLLYGSAPSIPKVPAAPQGHPLSSPYEWLAALVPTLPRDTEGNADEPHVRACLSEAGINISEDGLAEMLARCDVSPTGFPPFSDFMLCLSRPHRALPPSAQPVVMGGESALPDRYKPATPAEQSMGSAPPPDEKSAGPTGPPPLPRAPAMPMSDEEMQQTWRHMQVEQLTTHPHATTSRARPACTADDPGIPGGPRRSQNLPTSAYATPLPSRADEKGYAAADVSLDRRVRAPRNARPRHCVQAGS